MITGTIVTTDAMIEGGYVAVRGETIAAIGQGTPPPAARTIAFGDNLILPGLVDGHMHTSSSTGWPGIETATRSAAAGGVTTCCDMPYDVPHPVTDAVILADKIGWVERTAHVDMALYGTITKTGDGNVVSVTYKGTTSDYVIDSTTPIFTYAQGDKSLLVPGAAVFVIAQKKDDGSLTTARLTVEKDGVKPPM